MAYDFPHRWRPLALALVILLAGACAGTKKMNGTGTPGSGASSGGGGAGGIGGPGSGGSFVSGSGNAGGACQSDKRMFTRQTPSVFVLVDRSGSEFTNDTTGTYFTLRAAVLQVIQMLQAEVRFGFAAFYGNHPNGGACVPVFDKVDIADNNYGPINTLYMGLNRPTSGKIDTPAYAIMPMVQQALAADVAVSTGPKYVLFVTDSESDFCDDGNPLCPADALISRVQDLSNMGFGTLVIGLPTSLNAISPNVLQGLANAGAGLPVAVPAGGGATTATDVHAQCASDNGWSMAASAATLTTPTFATYSPTGGNATVFSPTSTSQQALADQISAALKTVRTCTFDLTGKIKVDTTQLDKATVLINGTAVPLSDTNGWHMIDPVTLELTGDTCNNWRNATTTQDIEFDFPCEIIIPT